MIPLNAKVKAVKGTPPMIHFAARKGNPTPPPVPYTAQSLIEMPAQVAYQAINVAECFHMNEHYGIDVEASIRQRINMVIDGTTRCVAVRDEVAFWEFNAAHLLGGERGQATTDLEGNIITIEA